MFKCISSSSDGDKILITTRKFALDVDSQK